MRTARFLLLASVAIGLFFQSEAQARPESQLLILSDIHFNPLANPALAAQLAAAEPDQWEAIFKQDPNSPVQKYGDDAVWSLLESVVSEARKMQPKPRLAVITGDILAHKFREKFSAALPGSDAAAFREFIRKTFQFVGLELQKAAGGAPVIYTAGNNDDECGDYALEPGGPFLKDTAATVQALAHIDEKALAPWLSIGSYVTINPLAPKHLVIALNTGFWSRRYTNACGPNGPAGDPGADVLTFLSGQLEQAEKRGDKVWLAYHIPPGIDGHTSARTNQVTPMWKPAYSDGFDKLMDRYRKTIELNLAGHTHLDDFRLVKTTHATALVLITPGISPNVGQNPAFRLLTVDSHAKPKDITTYYRPDLKSPEWKLEYSIRSTYGLKKIDAKSYESLYRQLGQSPAITGKWHLYYAVSRPDALSQNKSYQRALYCATGHADAAGYQTCVTETQ